MKYLKELKTNLFIAIKHNLIFIALLSIILGLEVYELDYSVYSPGGLINVDERISNREYVGSGSFNMTYVSYRRGSIMNLLIAKILPTYDIIKNEDITLSNEDITDMLNRDNIQILEAVSNATLISYKEAGKKADITKEYNYVYYIDPQAKTTLKVGDLVTACDNNTIEHYDDIYNCIQNHKLDDEINIKVIRNNREVNTKSRLTDAHIIGVIMKRIFNYDLDPNMSYKYDKNESGSSGGLMLALAMYNALVEEDITKGMKIAGTGTIEYDGSVGEISGVKYKIKGAVKNKVDLFIVPEENYQEAQQVIEENGFDIKLLRASTFEQVLNDLKNYN